jgi:poly-gamma-glutamate system protein
MIPSLGASSFGANRPEFTYLDMENFLFQKGLIHHRSAAASVGGAEDVGSDLSPEGRDLLEKAIVRHKTDLIAPKNIEENVSIRGRLYLSKGLPKVFINIGGAQINIGDYDSERRLVPGINKLKLTRNRSPNSMMEYFAQRGIPIIHLLNIHRLALEFNLPIDPTPLPEPGRSAVYAVEKIDVIFLMAAIVCFTGSGVCLFLNKKIFGASPVGEPTGKDMQAS